MAEQTTEKQTIKEFVNNLLDDLETGRITPEAAIVAAGQYEGLRKALTQHIEDLASSTVDGDGLSVEDVAQTLRAVSVGINAAPPQFQAEKPDAPLSPKEVLERAGTLRLSENIVAGAVTRQQKHVARLRKTFIERLVANWIARTRFEIEAGAIDEGAIIKKLQSLTDEELSGPNTVRVIESAFAAAPSAPRAIRDAASATDETKQELARGVHALSVAREIPKALYPRAGLPNLERFTTIVTTIIATSDLPAETAIERAETLSRVAEVVAGPHGRREDGEAIPTTFFTALAQGPAQKFIAGAADALFSQLSPLTRQDVIRTTFSRALEQAIAKTDNLTTRLGKDFVESELFRLVMDGAKKEFARAPSGGSRSGQAKGALDDILGAILVGPLTAPLLTSPRETLLAYFELLAMHARLPKGAPPILPGKFEAATLLLATASTGGAAPAGGVVASVLTAGASAFAKQLPSWERFYLMMVSLVSPGVSVGQAASGGVSLPAFGSPAGGGLGGAIGGALSWVGLGLAGVAGRAGGGLVGLLFGGGIPSPFGRRTEKTSFWDDTPLMIAVFIGATIILLFILPTFFNFGYIDKTKNLSALVTAAAEVMRRGRDKAPNFDAQYPQPPDYLDPSLFTGKTFGCLSFGPGLDTGEGVSRGLTENEVSRLTTVLEKYPQINVLSCGLSCPQRKINITTFPQISPDGYGGFAPHSHAGNVIFYPNVFTSYDDQLLAYLTAHELAHNIDWFGHRLSTGFQQLGCGSVPPSTYPFRGDIHESFAESVALYLINHPEIKTYCGGKAYNYLNSELNQCRQ